MRRPASQTCAAGVMLCRSVAPARARVSFGLVAQTSAMTRTMLRQVWRAPLATAPRSSRRGRRTRQASWFRGRGRTSRPRHSRVVRSGRRRAGARSRSVARSGDRCDRPMIHYWGAACASGRNLAMRRTEIYRRWDKCFLMDTVSGARRQLVVRAGRGCQGVYSLRSWCQGVRVSGSSFPRHPVTLTPCDPVYTLHSPCDPDHPRQFPANFQETPRISRLKAGYG